MRFWWQFQSGTRLSIGRNGCAARSLCAVAIAVALGPATAAADEEVRIAIATGRTKTTLEGNDLVVFRGDDGHEVLNVSGRARVRVQAMKKALVVHAGTSGNTAHKVDVRRLLVEAKDGIRVDGRLYHGRIAVERDRKASTMTVINRLPIETYLLGIIGNEMRPSWPMEALKAQAVAARSYALQRRMMMRSADRAYDLEATVLSQVYRGAERIAPAVVDAVAETRGEVLAFGHALAETLFHSTCGGQTVSAREAFGKSVPYLTATRCDDCQSSDNYRWHLKLSMTKLMHKLVSTKIVPGPVDRLEVRNGDLVAIRKKMPIRISRKLLRARLGYSILFSDRFEVSIEGSTVSFRGLGFGHGVGMCQWGARGQAARGRNYVEILAHYYAGARVVRIY